MSASDRTRALIIHPIDAGGPKIARSPEARLAEAIGLAAALDLNITDGLIETVREVRPATFFGTGKLDELAERVKRDEVELVIVDGVLTPVQQRNLEKALNAKVLDRTAVILEIFGERANTAEGTLQVELAHLNYQRSRLVRSWTHLERQRGGLGFVGGPGETQIEADRRMIAERIAKIETKLEKVVRMRGLHRQKRRRGPVPVVALVGYTNAGKSTLFNKITGSGVMAKDMLFATLDPTMRAVDLPGGRRIILSDTVGFVSNLPTQLVAAFRATLEEVLEADLMVHVQDVSNADSEPQARDVEAVLRELGVPELRLAEALNVYNKLDRLDAEEAAAWQRRAAHDPLALAISAETGDGVADLLAAITDRLAAGFIEGHVRIPLADGAAMAWLHEVGAYRGAEPEEDASDVQVKLSDADARRFESRFGYAIEG